MRKDSTKVDFAFFTIQTSCIIGLFITNNFNYMRMAITDFVFWLVYIILESKQKWTIPLYVRMIVILSIISNDYFGELLNLYITSSLFDRFQHIFGTYSMTLWAFFILQQFIRVKIMQRSLIIIFFLLISTTLGAWYEIIEFVQDELFKPNIKNQPSLLDTDLDLISDVIGGIIALCHYLISNKLKSFICFDLKELK